MDRIEIGERGRQQLDRLRTARASWGSSRMKQDFYAAILALLADCSNALLTGIPGSTQRIGIFTERLLRAAMAWASRLRTYRNGEVTQHNTDLAPVGQTHMNECRGGIRGSTLPTRLTLKA